MNYPKPDILNTELKECPVYLYVPQYTFEIVKDGRSIGIGDISHEQFNSVDGFDNFTDSMNFSLEQDADDILTETGLVVNDLNSQNEVCSLIISNISSQEQPIKLFNSYNNRSAPNYNNPNTVMILSALADRNYNQFLAKSENRPWRIGKLQIQILKKQAQMTDVEIFAKLRLIYRSSDAMGNQSSIPVRFFQDPWQQMSSFNEVDFSDAPQINGYSGYELNILPGCELLLTFLPVAQRIAITPRLRAIRAERQAARIEARLARRENRRQTREDDGEADQA